MKKNIKSLLTFKVLADAILIDFIMEKMHGISRNRAKALITNRVVLVNNAARKMLEVDDSQILNTKIQLYCDTDGELCFKDKIEQFKDTPLDVMENKPLEFNIEIDGRNLGASAPDVYPESTFTEISEYCKKQGVEDEATWFEKVREYESEVLVKRGN